MSEPLNPMAGLGHDTGQASPLVPEHKQTSEASWRIDLILLASAMVLAGILNWRAFVQDTLAIDEHVSFWIADWKSPSSLLNRSFRYSATPPLSFLLQQASLAAGGRDERSLRLPAAMSYLAALIAVWWVGRRWLTPLAGGLAAVLLAAQPALLAVSVAGRPYSLGVLLGIVAMHFTAMLRSDPSRPLRWLNWALANLALVQTHYLFAALWSAELAWLCCPGPARSLRRREWIYVLIVWMVCSLSVAPGLLRVWEERQFLNWTTRQPLLADLTTLILPVRWASFREPAMWAAGLLPFLWLAAVYRSWPHRWADVEQLRQVAANLGRVAIWFALPVGGLWLLGRFWLASLAAERYLVIYVPAAVLVLAGLLSLLRGKAAPVLAAGAVILFEGTLPHALSQTYRRPGPSEEEWQMVARTYVQSRVSPSDLVFVGSGLTEMALVPVHADDAIFQDYVTCRLGRMYTQRESRRLSLPMFWTPDLKGYYRREIARTLAATKPTTGMPPPPAIWLVAATDTDLLVQSLAQAEAMLAEAGASEWWHLKYETLTVVVYWFPRNP